MGQKAAFHPARGGAISVSSRGATGRPRISGNQSSALRRWAETRKLARGLGMEFGKVLSRWNLVFLPVAQVAKHLLDINKGYSGPSGQVHPGTSPVTRPAPSLGQEAGLGEGKCGARKEGRPPRDD